MGTAGLRRGTVDQLLARPRFISINTLQENVTPPACRGDFVCPFLYDPGMANRETHPSELPILTDPQEAAKAAKLRYVSDAKPGITRQRRGKGWSYYSPTGERITDEGELERLDTLVIPPAWEGVWISPYENGHILATGRDEKGRKQYIYHPRWREVRDETKFNRMILFADVLPTIRKIANQHLRLEGLPREKVLAAAVRVLEETLIRVGNEEYRRKNESFGLSTLRDKHVRVSGSTVEIEFTGKSGTEQEIEFRDRQLAQIIKECQDLPGYDLFQYVDDAGQVIDIGSGDVNDYLREITGEDFTAKDFRTWGGTVMAMRALFESVDEDGEPVSPTAAAVVKQVAAALGNTPAVCKRYYIHPNVLKCCDEDDLMQKARDAREQARERAKDRAAKYALSTEETATVAFLRACAVEA